MNERERKRETEGERERDGGRGRQTVRQTDKGREKQTERRAPARTPDTHVHMYKKHTHTERTDPPLMYFLTIHFHHSIITGSEGTACPTRQKDPSRNQKTTQKRSTSARLKRLTFMRSPRPCRLNTRAFSTLLGNPTANSSGLRPHVTTFSKVTTVSRLMRLAGLSQGKKAADESMLVVTSSLQSHTDSGSLTSKLQAQ